MVRIKICGITSVEDALAAAEAGADALGLNFYGGSPRCVSPETAEEIVACLPPLLVIVGVFVNEVPERIREVASRCRLSLVQLHGDEPPAFCARLGLRVIKAVRLRGESDLDRMKEYTVAGYLLDSYRQDAYGGTGEVADWDLARRAARLAPVILAGGLSAENVAQAVERVQPYGVDVSSGVERDPGRKDRDKVRAFIREARRAAAQMGRWG